jgi:DNA-binding transcriptional MocR family regulator
VELPQGINSRRLFDQALEDGISLMPGTVFAARERYRNFIRLSFGHPWGEDMDSGLARLGALIAQGA